MTQTIKQISTPRFEVTLFQTGLSFMIEWKNFKTEMSKVSELISDYNTAAYLFELKVSELEGH